MSDTALYQKLLNDAIRKQMTILGRQITLMKVKNIQGLTVTDDGSVGTLGNNPETVVRQFLEEFRELSSPLVKKTMQPLLSAIGPSLTEATAQPAAPQTGQPATLTTQTQPENKTESKSDEPASVEKN
ncbi:MAG TPA: hypothetical protein VLF93_00405 [Candidatus Saccharimonadales bacterium]|nr:hypothetical protein [Candidatus Saccharimonadales bacterium]